MSHLDGLTPGLTLLGDAALLTNTVAGRTGPVRVLGPGLHEVAARLIADGVEIEATVPGRRESRAYRRALRRAGCTAPRPTTADLRVELPVADAAFDVLICRLDPRAFPFPRHTVRELGRAVAPRGVVVLLSTANAPWPTGLVDAWAASANLFPQEEARDTTASSPFSGSVYEPR